VFAVALAIGANLYSGPRVNPNLTKTANHPVAEVSAAVNDLQTLEKNQDLYADFDMLDDLKTDTSQSTSSSNGSKAEL
jgi:hypothetical protein